ncbi:MAG: hypothetical protein ABL977_08365 [Candidatus Eisenbacteria bacterium]
MKARLDWILLGAVAVLAFGAGALWLAQDDDALELMADPPGVGATVLLDGKPVGVLSPMDNGAEVVIADAAHPRAAFPCVAPGDTIVRVGERWAVASISGVGPGKHMLTIITTTADTLSGPVEMFDSPSVSISIRCRTLWQTSR